MDFNDLPADVQLLHLNIQERLTELLRHEGPIKATGKIPDKLMDRMVQAVSEAQTQTVKDVGEIRVEEVGVRGLMVIVPRVAGWFTHERLSRSDGSNDY